MSPSSSKKRAAKTSGKAAKTSSRESSKRAASTASRRAVPDLSALNPLRTGMPALDSIVEVLTKTPPSSARAITADAALSGFRIIRTSEMDGYEEGAAESLTRGVLAAARPTGDNFAGTARRAAKISIADAETEEFEDLTELVRSLTPDRNMVNRRPRISTARNSNRVREEKRNVRVRVFLYAASKEDDNDFHLILGRDPNSPPEMYMNMELSGLPPRNSAAFEALSGARNAFKQLIDDLFEGDLPGSRYDFYDPPIPVIIEGSLFFDMNHATGQRPGPQSLKSRIPTIWEVHPITAFEFTP